MAPTLYDELRLVANYGVSQKSLRLYETRGLLRPIIVNGVRYYTSVDRVRLEIIIKGKRLGFSLAEIERLVSALPAIAQPTDASITAKLDPDRVFDEIQALTSRRDEIETLIYALKVRRDGE